MHEIFSPGFPGMLEAFYVQERLIESMLPEVFASLVRPPPDLLAPLKAARG